MSMFFVFGFGWVHLRTQSKIYVFFFFLMIMRMLGPWSSLVLWHWLIFSYLINQRVWMPSNWLIHLCRYEIFYQWLIWYIFEKLVKWFFKLVKAALCYISDGFWQRIKKSWTIDLKWLFTQSFGSLCCHVWYFWNHAGSSSSWFRLIFSFTPHSGTIPSRAFHV